MQFHAKKKEENDSSSAPTNHAYATNPRSRKSLNVFPSNTQEFLTPTLTMLCFPSIHEDVQTPTDVRKPQYSKKEEEELSQRALITKPSQNHSFQSC